MTELEKERQDYLRPSCNVVDVDTCMFICTSVMLDTQTSTEEEWENDTEVDGGDYEI
jgi:hypothetical protein